MEVGEDDLYAKPGARPQAKEEAYIFNITLYNHLSRGEATRPATGTGPAFLFILGKECWLELGAQEAVTTLEGG